MDVATGFQAIEEELRARALLQPKPHEVTEHLQSYRPQDSIRISSSYGRS
jgi:hypothetical protein